MPTDTDLAWAAGIIEGEGSVRINALTKHNHGALIVSVTSTDADMLEPLAEWFGGTVKPATTRVECKPAWRWTVASRQAAAVLVAVQPYLRVARIIVKVALALEFQAQKVTGRSNRTPEYRAQQVAYFDRMAQLNLRGVACPNAASHRR